MGTPIINQPQVGILAIGAIRKMPAVIETPEAILLAFAKNLSSPTVMITALLTEPWEVNL